MYSPKKSKIFKLIIATEIREWRKRQGIKISMV
jgi:hypothetical protein